MQTINLFWLLKCEDILPFWDLYHCKFNNFGNNKQVINNENNHELHPYTVKQLSGFSLHAKNIASHFSKAMI